MQNLDLTKKKNQFALPYTPLRAGWHLLPFVFVTHTSRVPHTEMILLLHVYTETTTIQTERTVDLIIKGSTVLEHLLGALDIEEDVGKGPDGILVATHHHVGKAHVVEGGDLAGWYTRVQVLQRISLNMIGYSMHMAQISLMA